MKYFFFFILFANYLIKTKGNFSLGAWTPIDTTTENVIDLAKKAVEKFNFEENEEVEFSGVSNALQQVVAGMNYKLIIKTTLKECPIKNKCIKYLEATIFEQVWTNTLNITVEALPPVTTETPTRSIYKSIHLETSVEEYIKSFYSYQK
uniref:Cystatin domain-containing protein n=1 Tax=Strongyloides papillosus TaxID=174720 RepID=A0A0N5BGF0_STREA